MDPDLVPALIYLLGAKGFGEVMEILGNPIDSHDFKASMEMFRRTKVSRNKMSASAAGRVHSQATRNKMSASNTGKIEKKFN